ncbi:flagellar biosynthesis protein FlhA [Hasllibacter halocynthiae]|uniref:Flagellar biosynthesis protein FlhA n=1 Tax=Hasllibacter halocynthiae TaxID=595589 RepID=A0A2T0X2W7_9RHOB|nr:flagellar biosynthesis protein FlhA [Hasllibacter halocynthiae]PRY93204.1 flagellar biosynthesis protein FlhA [Hasllibacter halocynthiae]
MRAAAAALLNPAIGMAVALLAIILMMILPMPTWALDLGLALSFGLAILIFTTALFVERPLDFSIFPTVLLASLMLRLSLNVSSTKLIISQGHTGTDAAGDVIEGFASFVMGGSLSIGLVVFLVLLIVNFMVITKGAGRMAEVGARFALDGMPGRQLAIDADMSAGAIDHAEARRRRETELAETTFFGSLDGASKFLKGDAVAGLLITLLNVVAGIAIGTIVHGMPAATALETYAILTVGDGLVTQIPAVVISIAGALLLARGGATGTTDGAMLAQFGRRPEAVGAVAALMMLLAAVPGLPALPFLALAAGLGFGAWRLSLRPAEAAPAEDVAPAPAGPSIGDVLELDDIHLTFASDVVPAVMGAGTGLEARIETMRHHVARRYGLILPEIRLTDDPALEAGRYAVSVQGVERGQGVLRPGRMLALAGSGPPPPGEAVTEPVYGAPAAWIDAGAAPAAEMDGFTVVSPPEVLATHLLEVVKSDLGRLLTLKSLRRLLDAFAEPSDPARAAANRRLLDELIPDKVPVDLLLSVLRALLEEEVSIRNLGAILEAVAEIRPADPRADAVVEHVRRRLGFQLVAPLRRADGTIPLIQLAPEWEERFAAHETPDADVALPPDLFGRLTAGLGEKLAEAAGADVAVVTSGRRRRFLRTVAAAAGLTAPVLSYDEIGLEARPSLVGRVPA